MIKNILLTTLRNFRKNQFFVIINILGLGLTLACSIVAYYNYKFDADFDKVHVNSEEIYKVEITKESNGQFRPYGITPVELKDQIDGALSGVEKTLRFNSNGLAIKYDEKILDKRVGYADDGFFELFTFNILKGDIESYRDISNALVTEEFAEAYFGDEEALGKVITIYNDQGKGINYVISGLLENPPPNNSFFFDVLIHFDNYEKIVEDSQRDWNDFTAATFLHIPNASNVNTIEELLQPYVEVYNKSDQTFKIASYYLIAFEETSKSDRNVWNNFLRSGMHPAAVLAPTIMALLVLLLACFNYTNTSIAISSKRLKEIGIRKVVGGIRRQMIFQFLLENVVLCFLALIVAVIVGNYLLAGYSAMWGGMDLRINLKEDLDFWIFLIGMLVFTALFAGSYPAFYISKFHPIPILKGVSKFAGNNLFTRILLVFQFSIALTGIISAVIFTQNAYFQDSIYLGFKKDEVVAVPIDNALLDQFKNHISQNPMIKELGESEEHVGWGRYIRDIEYDNQKMEIAGQDIGDNYFETMGLIMLEGRGFEPQYANTDRDNSVIVNEMFVKAFNMENPIGKKIKLMDTVDLTIVGVMKDFYPNGFWQKIDPMIFRRGSEDKMRMIVTQTDVENIKELDDYLRAEWTKLFPNNLYEGFVQNRILADAKLINENATKMFVFLAILALIISLIGLYTLISLIVIKKTQEIGIRKVLGSSVQRLMILLNKDFAIIMIIASILGGFIGYSLSEMLLESIWEVYIKINAISLLVPIVFLFIISLSTISWRIYQAAVQNPVDAIRYE